MKFKKKLLRVNLTLFDGGAAAGGDGGAPTGLGAAAPGQGDTGAMGETLASPAPTRRGKSGESKVVYGKQAAPAQSGGVPSGDTPQQTGPSDAGKGKEKGGETPPATLDERRKAFMALVSGDGEYKDVFTEQMQRVIDRRFKETKGLERQLASHKPIMDALMERYGIPDGDSAKLLSALENDNAYLLQAAEEAGMSVEQYKRFQSLQRENAALVEAERARKSHEAANRQLAKWYGEAEAVRQTYPGFDLNAEVKDARFLSMLRAGIPVQHAYEVIHMEEIKTAAARQAAQQTEKSVVDSIRAKGQRPPENGTAAQSAFTVKDDVSKLSREDRAEIIRRVRRGEKITF